RSSMPALRSGSPGLSTKSSPSGSGLRRSKTMTSTWYHAAAAGSGDARQASSSTPARKRSRLRSGCAAQCDFIEEIGKCRDAFGGGAEFARDAQFITPVQPVRLGLRLDEPDD